MPSTVTTLAAATVAATAAIAAATATTKTLPSLTYYNELRLSNYFLYDNVFVVYFLSSIHWFI